MRRSVSTLLAGLVLVLGLPVLAVATAAPALATGPAVSCSHVAEAISTSGSATTGSFTVTPNALILVSATQRNASSTWPTVPTVTGQGMTWIHLGGPIVAQDSSPERAGIVVFRGMTATPSSSGTVTVSGGATNVAVNVDQCINVATSGTNGSGAIVTSATNTSAPTLPGVSNSGGTVTMPTAASASNLTWLSSGSVLPWDCMKPSSPAADTNEQETASAGNAAVSSGFYQPPVTSPGFAFSAASPNYALCPSTSQWGAMAIEVANGSGGTPSNNDGVQCDAKTFYDSDGGAWVTLSARTLGTVPTGAQIQKAWMGTWDSEDGLVGTPNFSDADNTVTLPLPAPSSRPSWGWVATFEYAVKLPSGSSGAPISAPSDEWSADANGDAWHTEKEFIKGWAAATSEAGWVGAAASTTVEATAASAAAASAAAIGTFALSYYATTKFLNAGASAAGWTDSKADPVHLGPAARGFSPAGTRFYSGDSVVGSGSTWTSYEHVCNVVVRPDAPPNDQSGSVVNPPPTNPTSTDGGAGTVDPCSTGVRVPVLSWIVGGFKQLACAIGSLFGDLLDLVRTLFIPRNIDWSSLIDTADTSFPFNIATGIVESGVTIGDGVTGAVSDGVACADVDVGGIVNDATSSIRPTGSPTFSGFDLKLPTPSSAGCARYAAGSGLQDKVGDVLGFRVLIRDLLLASLYIGFGYAVIAAVTQVGGEDDL